LDRAPTRNESERRGAQPSFPLAIQEIQGDFIHFGRQYVVPNDETTVNVSPECLSGDGYSRAIFALRLPTLITAFEADQLVPVPACAGRRKGQKSKGKRGKRAGGNRYSANNMSLSTFRSPIVPSQLRTTLRQLFIFQLSGASPTLCRRYNPNSVYQPEVSGATGTVPGFSELAALYGFYRVLGYKYKAQFVNMQAFPVTIFALNSNNDPTTGATVASVANALGHFKILSAATGMDKATLAKKMQISNVVGTTAIATADSYRSLINANPADITWLGLGAQSNTGANLTIGVTVTLELEMYVELYDRLLQT
jgi:hypothetical protein